MQNTLSRCKRSMPVSSQPRFIKPVGTGNLNPPTQPQTRRIDPTSSNEPVPTTAEGQNSAGSGVDKVYQANHPTTRMAQAKNFVSCQHPAKLQAMTSSAPTRPLNPRIMQFCRLYVSNGGQGAAAYRDAGYSPNGADRGAHVLLSKPEVKAQMEKIRASLHRDGATTRAYVLDRLSYFAEHAKPDSAAIRAAELLGKTERMFVDVHEGSPTAGDVPQLRSYTLEELRELRAVMVDGVNAKQVALEDAGAREDVVDVESEGVE